MKLRVTPLSGLYNRIFKSLLLPSRTINLPVTLNFEVGVLEDTTDGIRRSLLKTRSILSSSEFSQRSIAEIVRQRTREITGLCGESDAGVGNQAARVLSFGLVARFRMCE
jgi:hypothetical protein